jgi:hypothetical protein
MFSGARYVNFYKIFFKKPKFFILKFEVDFKNHNFVAIYFKEPFEVLMIIYRYVFKKPEIFLKTMKIVEFSQL